LTTAGPVGPEDSTSDPETLTADKPSVLFVCVQRGQIPNCRRLLTHLAGGQIEVRSAGSEPADKINATAAHAMAEEGIDITAENPKILTTDAVEASDVVITAGCGDTCPHAGCLVVGRGRLAGPVTRSWS
jgi:hypothetical protein